MLLFLIKNMNASYISKITKKQNNILIEIEDEIILNIISSSILHHIDL